VYRASYVKQRGRGLGNFFRGIWKFVKPWAKQGIKAVGREVRDTGIKTLTDIGEGRSLKEALQTRSLEAVDNLKRKAEDKMRRMAGAGLRAPKRAKVGRVKTRNQKIKKRTQVGGKRKKPWRRRTPNDVFR
jgi:hypothetical protein